MDNIFKNYLNLKDFVIISNSLQVKLHIYIIQINSTKYVYKKIKKKL